MKNEDDRLDLLLRQWRCPVEKDPQLGAQVWQRIAAREESPWSRMDIVTGWLGGSIAGPALAASLLLAAVLGGIGVAELRVQGARQFTSVHDQEQAYFESINPVAQARHDFHR